MFRIFLTIVFLALLSCSSFAQNSRKIDSLKQELSIATADTSRMMILGGLIRATKRSALFEETEYYLKKEQELALKMNKPRALAVSCINRADMFFTRHYQFDSALQLLHQGLKILNKSKKDSAWNGYGGIYNFLGLIYKNTEQYDSTIFYYKKQLKFANKYDNKGLALVTYHNLSRLYNVMGNHDKALSHAFLYLEMAQKRGRKRTIGGACKIIAEQYYSLGAFEQALQYVNRALKLEGGTGRQETTMHSLYELKAKILDRLDKPSEAIDLLKTNFSFLRRTYGEKHPKLVNTLAHLSRLRINENETVAAQDYIDQALDISKNYDFRYHTDLLEVRSEIEVSVGDFAKAIETLNEALYYSKGSRQEQLGVYEKIGDLQNKLGNFKESEEAYSNSFHLNTDTYTNDPTLAELNRYWNNTVRIMKRALVLEQQYAMSSDEEDLQKSLNSYQLGDSLVVELRSLYKQQSSEIDFNELFGDLYAGGARTALGLFELTGNSEYLELSFKFSEKKKGAVLFNAIRRARNFTFSNVPDSVLELEEELKSNIQFYQTRLANKKSLKDSVKIKNYENKLFLAKRDYESLVIRMQDDFPEYFRLKHRRNFLSLKEVQDKLSNDQRLMEYFWMGDEFITFIIDNKDVKAIRTKVEMNVDSLVLKLKKSIHSRDLKIHEFSAKMFEFLFSGIEVHEGIRELIIVPDGILWYVNFDLLNQKDADGPRYLIEDYSISYANSANLLFGDFTETLKTKQACLAFSYADSTSDFTGKATDFAVLRASDSPLPGTRNEVNSIASILPGVYYYGNEANEQNFKEYSDKYAILHLAVHGEIDDSNPNYSKLKFSSNTPDTLEDNQLHVFELYNMKLNAELAVLSACNSGTGELLNGEGMMSIGRAFQYAGVKSLMISNWEVVDEVAPELMKSFYQNLKDGMSKSEALRMAKLNYLKTAGPNRNHPYFWASFAVIGNNDPVFRENYNWYIAGAALLLLVGIGYFRRKNQPGQKQIL